jgi:hypothetical protein
MKTTLLFAVILFMAVNIFPQKEILNFNPKPNKTSSLLSQIYLPDSVFLYSTTDSLLLTASYDQTGSMTMRLVKAWYNGGWGNYMLDVMTYTGQPDNSVDLKQLWQNGKWVNYTKDSSTYDTKGNMLVHTFNYWSNGVWVDSIYSVRTYDANGCMLTNFSQYLTNGYLVNHDRSTYSNDGSGHHLTYLFEIWKNNNWAFSDMYSYTWNNGKLETSQWQYYANSVWNLGTLDTYTYNSDGKVEILEIKSGATGVWKPSQKQIHSFQNGFETSWLMQNWDGAVYVDISRYNYTNDSKGNVLTSVYQNYQNSKWNDYLQSVFTYDANGNELTGYNTQWYTNQWKPVDGSFDVKINGDDYYFTGYSINLKYILVSTGIAADNSSIIKGYSLSQNYPNPFNPSTTINYSVPKSGPVELIVYNVMGREVVTLVNEQKPVGNYSVKFDAGKFTSGVYFYQLKSGDFISTRKLIILK